LHDLSEQHRRIFQIIGEIASEAGQEVYVVGGYVRDYYLGRLDPDEVADIDFVSTGSGVELARKVADVLKSTEVTVYKQFGTAQIRHKLLDLEFVGARKESYRKNSRKPLVEDGTIEDDQLRRDLTINALSWKLNPDDFGLLVDPFNGIQDLNDKIIRTPIDPEKTFDDDPLRMMRAIRFATQLNFTIEKDTLAAISKMADRLQIISQERITDELNKIILADKPSVGFKLLFETGLLKQFLPEMAALHGVKVRNKIRHKDNFWHTLEVLDNVSEVSDNLWLRWAAIMHDIAKPPTQRFVDGIGWTFHGHEMLGAKWTAKIFKRLSLPLDERMKYVQKLVRLHLRPIALVSDVVSDSAVRRLIFDAGDDIDDLMQLCKADITSKNEEKVKQYLNNFRKVEKKIIEVEEKDKIRNWKHPLSGELIMETLDLTEGPVIGKIKEAVKEAILDGKIPNNHDAAFEYMMEIKDHYI
jgi:tRNA nucleotidyltransferase (CCA-adding enzyme)